MDITIAFDSADGFLTFDEGSKKLIIEDISDASVKAGFHTISITLDDGVNQVLEDVILDVRDPPDESEQ